MKIYQIRKGESSWNVEIQKVEVDSVKGQWYIQDGRMNKMETSWTSCYVTEQEAKDELIKAIEGHISRHKNELQQLNSRLGQVRKIKVLSGKELTNEK